VDSRHRVAARVLPPLSSHQDLASTMRGGMEKSFVWGVTLDAAHKEQKWEGTATENTVDCTVTTHTLSVRQILIEDQAATFHLTAGSGPVYISGTHQTETNIIGEDDMDDLPDEGEEEEEEEDEVVDSPPKKKSKK
ncbi:hypothetical protein OTU49_008029, partial [Cherax quadricarinatus]